MAQVKSYILDTCSIYVANLTDLDEFTTCIADENYLGFTNGGVKVVATPNVREIEFDGKRGRRIKDAERILGWEVGVETKGLELNETSLAISLVEADSSLTASGYTAYRPSNEVTYKDLILVGTMQGKTKPCVIVVKDCFNESGVSIEMADETEGTYEMSCFGHYTYNPETDANNTTKAPFGVFIPTA